jgi:hypothetical protein
MVHATWSDRWRKVQARIGGDVVQGPAVAVQPYAQKMREWVRDATTHRLLRWTMDDLAIYSP